jgi:hypothetical protein
MDMIRHLVLIPVMLIMSYLHAQTIEFSDTNFYNKLIETGIDTNDNSLIEEPEVAGISDLNISDANIHSLNGIEAFTSLETLDCSLNFLDTLILDSNTNLNSLSCTYNQLVYLSVNENVLLEDIDCGLNSLSTLNVSNLGNLKNLACFANNLSTLDVSDNTLLETLYVMNNELTQIDVSGNTFLTELGLNANNLTSLNLESNSYLVYLDLKYMPDLNEVCVGSSFDTNLIEVDTTGSPNVVFTNCSSGSEEYNLSGNDIQSYQQNGSLLISSNNGDILQTIQIYSISGSKLIDESLRNNTVDISKLNKGVYLCKIITSDGPRIFKFVKRF